MNMRKSMLMAMALALMSAGDRDVYGQRGFNRPKRTVPEPPPMTPERERAIMDSMDKQMHDFNINGTIIRARDKKTARKIYANKKGGKK